MLSEASTQGTTTPPLSFRIAALAFDSQTLDPEGRGAPKGGTCGSTHFGHQADHQARERLTAGFSECAEGEGLQDGSRSSSQSGSQTDAYEEVNEEEVLEITEQELLTLLDAQEPSLQVCGRLFCHDAADLPPLKQLTAEQVRRFQSNGFLVVDGFLGAPVSWALRQETLALHKRGDLLDARQMNGDAAATHFTDLSARGDAMMWIYPEQRPTAGACPGLDAAIAQLQELQSEIAQLLRLRRRTAEYQLACYSASGAQYVRHRDALPDDGGEEHQRRVTAIVYGNPQWQPEHGGCLRIWVPPGSNIAASAAALSSMEASPAGPTVQESCKEADTAALAPAPSEGGAHRIGATADAFSSAVGKSSPLSEALLQVCFIDGEAVVDVEPLAGRLVLILSGAVDHAVLPSQQQRVALTAWCQ